MTTELMTLKQLRDQIQAFATQKPRDTESANYYVEMNVLLLDDWWKSIDAHIAPQPAEQPRGEQPSNEKLGRFGHHPDPATDFCVEAECLIGELYNASVGFEKESPSREELDRRVSAALSFVVGGDPFAVRAKQQLRAALAQPEPEQAVGDVVLAGKYGDVLRPFITLMDRELHANAGKGDRPGWLAMDRKTALLEIFYHLAKLQKAAKDDDQERIREYGADVANMAMMLVDVCGSLDVTPCPAVATHAEVTELRRALTALLVDHDLDHGPGACGCRLEPENAGHTCSACLARTALASPSVGAVVPDRKLLRAVFDKAWQEARESEQVPATEWADRIIDNVLAAAPEVPRG